MKFTTSSRGGTAPSRWIAIDDRSVALADLGQPGPWTVYTKGEAVVVAPIKRPPWARSWGRDAAGLFATPFDVPGEAPRLRIEGGVSAASKASPRSGLFAPALESGDLVMVGVDEEFGVFMDLGSSGSVMRMRWIDSDALEAESGDRGFWISERPVSLTSNSTGQRGTSVERVVDERIVPLTLAEAALAMSTITNQLPAGWTADIPTDSQWNRAIEGAYNVSSTTNAIYLRESRNAFGIYLFNDQIAAWMTSTPIDTNPIDGITDPTTNKITSPHAGYSGRFLLYVVLKYFVPI